MLSPGSTVSPIHPNTILFQSSSISSNCCFGGRSPARSPRLVICMELHMPAHANSAGPAAASERKAGMGRWVGNDRKHTQIQIHPTCTVASNSGHEIKNVRGCNYFCAVGLLGRCSPPSLFAGSSHFGSIPFLKSASDSTFALRRCSSSRLHS
eukprot:SAG31_NODE_12204_length_959_cov_1.013953_1_plen_153_part_00